MGTISNRPKSTENVNQSAVEQRKREIADGKPTGMSEGDEHRLQTHEETQKTTVGNVGSQDPSRIGQGRDRRTGEKK
jgi:hypothetical protein